MDSPVSQDNLEFARKVGYLTKGLVYCLMGGMTALWAFDMGGEKGDKAAVKELIQEQPLGKVLLALVAIGLALYAAYRLSEAFDGLNAATLEHREIFKRLGYGFSGAGYLLTSLAFGREVFGFLRSDDDGSTRLIGSVLAWPGGGLVIAGLGLILVGVGVVQGYKGLSGNYLDQLRVRLVNHGKEELFRKAGMFGYVARAVVFVVLGGLLTLAAYHHSSESYQGTEGVFSYLESLPFGGIILGVVAIGLLSYGLFMFVIAIYGKRA